MTTSTEPAGRAVVLDPTWPVLDLAAELAGVTVVHLTDKARGRALAQVWSTSDAGHPARGTSSTVGLVSGVAAGVAGQLVRFGAVGVASTLAYLALFVILRGETGAQVANLVALLLTAVANTAANRRLTFGVSGSGHARDQAQGLALFGLGLASTSGSLAALHVLVPTPARGLEVAGLVTANLTATVLRFVAMRVWMFGPRATDARTTDARSSGSAGRPRHCEETS